jgi:hypothetical protein
MHHKTKSTKAVGQVELLEVQRCLKLLKVHLRREPPPYFPNIVSPRSAVKSMKVQAVYHDVGIPKYGQTEEDVVTSEDRQQCKDCGRRFNAEAMEKHSRICRRVFMTKRKQFSVKR